MTTLHTQDMACKLVGYVGLSIKVQEGVDCIMVNHNLGVERMMLVKKTNPLDDVENFHLELLESIQTGVVGFKNNSGR